ncbi:MAG: DinB family protein [Candidatus Sumerlaeia bacterium]|nr:DinB family protein [Candidatus Sumerlaeia bacterium]
MPSSATIPLEAVLRAWDRHNQALLNLLALIPEGGLSARAAEGSPTVSEVLSHAHHERLVSVAEEAPEAARAVPGREWAHEPDPAVLARQIAESAAAVREAVRGRVEAGRPLESSFDHPVTLIHFLTFHEGYHRGQIKLALKVAGVPLSDDVVGEPVWGFWRERG